MTVKTYSHTIVLSDIHLSDAEPVHPDNPLWKRYKRKRYFIDSKFKGMVQHVLGEVEGPMELIFNGDVFDFDSVMSMPNSISGEKLTWLEKHRGLAATEAKSLYKIQQIVQDHPIFFDVLKDVVEKGHRLIFVIGNHDVELHWPKVQQALRDRLGEKAKDDKGLRFPEWFYISEKDTLIEHGNQYDAYSISSSPIHPHIKRLGKIYIRLPFGNLANRYIMNGLGLFNPHAESTYIKSVPEYVEFFYKYMMRVQPMVLWTWLWGAGVTLVRTMDEGFRPAVKDPLKVEERVMEIAIRAQTRPRVVRGLKELHVHPAYFNPLKIMKELWLDRAFFFLGVFFVSFFLISAVNLFFKISLMWMLIPLGLLLPIFIFYARTVESEIYKVQGAAEARAPVAATLARVNRVIQGHTHKEKHTSVQGTELINTGTWSPAYYDPECTLPYGRQCFVWIRPSTEHEGRVSRLYEWKDPGVEVIPPLSQPE